MEYSLVKDLEYSKEILHLSDEKFSKLLGISRSTYNRWRNGSVFPEKPALEKVYSAIYSEGINLNRVYEDLYLSLEKGNSKLLLHGSKMGLKEEPSVAFSAAQKDFGKGFYTGESVNQAISFVSGYKSAVLYYFLLENTSKIKTVNFDVSIDWMILVAYFRGKIDAYKNSSVLKKALKKIENADLIIAPIADNTMYSVINEFIEGSITDKQCINCLSANRLGKQYVFLNDSVIRKNLKMLRKAYICEAEKKAYEKEKYEETSIGKTKVILAKRKYAGVGKYIEELLV